MSTDPLHRSFPVSGPIRLDARVAAGTVEITASDRSDATVEIRPLDDSKPTLTAIERARVEFHGNQLDVHLQEKWLGRTGHVAVIVELPAGSTVATKVASADVTIAGPIGGLEVATASGNVDVGPVDGDAKVNSASGDVSIGAVNGDLDVKTASGNIRVGAARTARLHTASGDLKIGRLDGDGLARSASGDILVGEVWSGTVDLTTVSGRVHVAVPPGRLVWLDLSTVSGRTDSELAAEDTPDDAPVVTVRARSVSGRILISRVCIHVTFSTPGCHLDPCTLFAQEDPLMTSATGAVTRTADRALITFVRLPPQPVDEVWAALTDPAIVSQWMAPATIDARGGRHIDIDFGGEGGRTTGTILIFDPPRTLEHEWHFTGEAASVVRYDLAPDGAGTILALTHRRVGTAFAGGYAPGWHTYLDRLSAVLDGTDVPDWDERFAAVRAEYR